MARRSTSHREAGFNLIEVSLVLAIMGVLVTMTTTGSVAYMDVKRSDSTKVKLDTIEEAITRYAAAAKRLPCPADGTLSATNTSSGLENRSSGGTCLGTQKVGVVPWVTLGLPKEAVLDTWGRYITMRVDEDLVKDNVLASVTDLQGTVKDKGLYVSEIVSCDSLRSIMDPASTPSTGAAYVLISHGKDGLGAISSLGSHQAKPTNTCHQDNNANNNAVATDATAPYVTGGPAEGFDDIVRAAPASQVIIKAGLLS